MSEKPTIAVDFDGVLHAYSDGYKDGTIYDDPVPGSKNALGILKKKYRIIIFSTRNYDRTIKGQQQSNQVSEIKQWLKQHEIPYDEIYTGPDKPLFDLLIDDNAYRFEGNWHQTLIDVERLKLE